jgi:hypothetical protein
MGRVCRTNLGEVECIYILVGEPEGKKRLGRPRQRWIDNIIMGLREIGYYGMDWTDLAQDSDQWRAIVNTVINLRVAQNFGKFLSSCTTGDFLRWARFIEVG